MSEPQQCLESASATTKTDNDVTYGITNTGNYKYLLRNTLDTVLCSVH